MSCMEQSSRPPPLHYYCVNVESYQTSCCCKLLMMWSDCCVRWRWWVSHAISLTWVALTEYIYCCWRCAQATKWGCVGPTYAVVFTWDLLPPSTAWLLFSARSCLFPLSLWISLQCRSLNLLGVFPINVHLFLSKVAADSLFAAFHKSLFPTWSRILLNSMTHSKFSFEGHFRK